ncbi:MAG: bifunctional 4-hydroxy-2-oxoglutarate aldolase/2-dehydro-3-deoxy-phosphogluconate aldolase [Planctomycetaceae bacterium]
MSRHDDLQRILDNGIVAIIRATSSERLVEVARALCDGGIDVVEVTFTVPGVLEIISAVRKALGKNLLLGAGTVLDSESARAALLAGAEFLVSPTVNLDVIRLAHRYDKLVLPGAFTPTEVLTAWEAGADIVKLFPADLGGPGYLKSLRGPLPQVRLLPTGGVNLDTIAEFFKSGACAVGLGGALIEPQAVETGDVARIQGLAERYVVAVRQARAAVASG